MERSIQKQIYRRVVSFIHLAEKNQHIGDEEREKKVSKDTYSFLNAAYKRREF